MEEFYLVGEEIIEDSKLVVAVVELDEDEDGDHDEEEEGVDVAEEDDEDGVVLHLFGLLLTRTSY